jgi:hypothetical protein
MDTLFLVCAGLGGTILVLQTLAGMIGLGAEQDLDADISHGPQPDASTAFFKVLSFKSASAALAFFGLGGLTAQYYKLSTPAVWSAAVFAGLAALYAVAWVMGLFQKLRQDGTARIETAVGETGTVYLRVPGSNTGPGKVTLVVQNRTVECDAFTSHAADIPTGATVRVVAALGPTAVEVEPVTA